ncbi:MAG: hypothetical protein R6V29_05795, partial [Spirochaetia bacterium]
TTLAESAGGTHISLYMPTVRAGRETRQNPTRFKNLLKRAREELTSGQVGPGELERLIDPVEHYGAQPEVWKRQQEGLAIFTSPQVFRVIQVPFEVEEFVTAGPRFHLKPILQLLLGDTDYYVLTLGLGGCRLYRGNRFSIETVEVPGMPKGMEDVLQYDDIESPHKTGQRMPGRHGTQNTAIHAHATADEKLKRDMDRYLRRVERSVSEHLNGSHEPLVLAGTDYVLPIYRQHNRYAQLLDEDIAVNPNSLDPTSLRDAVWERVEPRYEERRREAVDRYHSSKDHGRTADGLEDLVPAAMSARIQTIFARSDTHVWGTMAADGSSAEIHTVKQPGDVDLVDAVVVESLRRGAEVYIDTEEVPAEENAAAAVLRY